MHDFAQSTFDLIATTSEKPKIIIAFEKEVKLGFYFIYN